jgi:beta-lactamase superfamily II metal-dependent hydrolase
MLRIYAYNAGKGDCVRIEFGNGRNILIDTGVTRFAPEFMKLCDGLESADILVLTHADDDHIGGILSALRYGWKCPFKEVRMNASSSPDSVTNAYLSTRQNDEVYSRLLRQGVIVKPLHNGDDIIIEDAGIRTLAPTQIISDTVRRNTPLAYHIDYGKSLAVLADEPIGVNDSSLSNKNSIVFIFEYNGRSLLFTGDAWAEDVINALGEGSHSFDLVKLSHHGSIANISEAFPAHIQSQNFLICTDGTMHPDKQTIAKLVKWYGKINVYSPSNWWNKGFFTAEDDKECVNLIHKEGLVIEW